MPGPRRLEIDFMKAIGVLAVLLIHSKIGFIEFAEPWEIWMLEVTRFAVPSFLFVSGYLYASKIADALTTRRRLRRLLLPYFALSLVVLALRVWIGPPLDAEGVVFDLLFGDATTQYYYVFVILTLVLVTPLFQRSPFWLLALLCLAFAATRLVHELDLFPLRAIWGFRSPTTWWSFFLLGWLVERAGPRLHERLEARAWPLLLVLLALWLPLSFATLAPQPNPRERDGISCRGLPCPDKERPGARRIEAFGRVGVACACEPFLAEEPSQATRVARWALPYLSLAGLWILGIRLRTSSPFLRTLSDASYSYYLVHVLPLMLLAELYRQTGADPPYLATWAITLLTTTAIVLSIHRLAPRWSRDLIGY